jgi:hypothetical protein
MSTSMPFQFFKSILLLDQDLVDHFTCPICLQILDDPVSCYKGHGFYRKCLEEAMDRSQNCPCCTAPLTQPLTSLLGMRNLIMVSRVCCFSLLSALEAAEASATPRDAVLSNGGCTWTGKFENAENHFNECGFVEVTCSFEGCGTTLLRRELAEHQTKCSHRTVTCKGCDERMKATVLECTNLLV